METELASLGQLLGDPHRPFVAILGGAKPETKLPVIEHLLDRADRILLGGVMATTFLKARGMEIGRSRVGDDVEGARRLLDAAESARAELFLPDDVVVAEAPRADAETETVEATAVPADGMILDIGPRTIERYAEAIGEEGAKVWNGTLGAEEFEPFQTGSHFLAAALGERTAIGDAGRFVSVVGGGDTVAFVAKHQFAHLFSYVSMAGGALLHWLSGRPLPGVEALRGDRTAP
jgi:phosphoglycerate kinase